MFLPELWVFVLLFVCAFLALSKQRTRRNRKNTSMLASPDATSREFVGVSPTRWREQGFDDESLVFVLTDCKAFTRRMTGETREASAFVFVLPRERFPRELNAILPRVTVRGCSLVMVHRAVSGAVVFREAKPLVMRMAGES